MSSHYSAGQYNRPFKATRLKNWQYGINHPGTYANRRCCATQFIADNRGYICCDCKKDRCKSPWGDYRQWIWEETSPCICVDRIRHPEEYDRPPCSIVVTRERPKHVREAKAAACTLTKVLFQPPPQAEVKVIQKNPPDQCPPQQPCGSPQPTDDRQGDQTNNTCPNSMEVNDGSQNRSIDSTVNPKQDNSIAVNIDPRAFPCGMDVDADLSQLKHGAQLDVQLPAML